MNKRAYLRRIQALQNRGTSTLIVCTMPDGNKQTIKRSRFNAVCNEAVNGINSPETAIVLAMVADDSGTRMGELLQMLF